MYFDEEFFDQSSLVIGCDEVGRGPLAGPVVGCAVKIDQFDDFSFLRLLDLGVNDSKKLSTKKRKRILEELNIDLYSLKPNEKYSAHFQGIEIEFSIGEISSAIIDEINILNASLMAMENACKVLSIGQRSTILIDGNKVFKRPLFNWNLKSVVKGDSKSIIIGLASIIAKEYRDHLMGKFDYVYPGYNLSKHAGYPTKNHKESLLKLGPSPIHRKTFKGVKELCQN